MSYCCLKCKSGKGITYVDGNTLKTGGSVNFLVRYDDYFINRFKNNRILFPIESRYSCEHIGKY